MKTTRLTLVLALLALAPALAAQKESEKRFGVYTRALRVGFGVADMRSENKVAEYIPGIAFNVGLAMSLGWRGVLQLQPEALFLARSSMGRDDFYLGGSYVGKRETAYEFSEAQAGCLVKIGIPTWTDPPPEIRRRTRRDLRERRHLPYVAGGPLWGRRVESKRVIRVADDPTIQPLSDTWFSDENLDLDWVLAAGYEYMRAEGGGLGIELRYSWRDIPETTRLGDEVVLGTYTLEVSYLF